MARFPDDWTSHTASRDGRPSWRDSSSAPFTVLVYTVLMAVCSGHAVGDVKSSASSKEQRVRRSWTEVRAETQNVFDECERILIRLLDNRPLGAPIFSGTTSNSLQPDTCYQEFKFRLNIDNRFPDTVPILDVRLERDYSHELGAASSFRIVPNVVQREGKLLFAAMIDYLKNKKCLYEVIDPSSEEGKKFTENYRKRYALP